MKKTIILLSAFLLAIGMASSAAAGIIFYDNFNRPNNNSVGHGWGEIEDEHNDVAIRNNYLRLRDNKFGVPDAAVYQGISTYGYQDIYLSFDWYASRNTEDNDYLYVSWDTGDEDDINLWEDKIVFSQPLDGRDSWHSYTIDFLPEVDNLHDFRLAIWTDVSFFNEFAKIDNVKLYGTKAVPEPSTLVFVGVSLLSVLGIGRKRLIKK